jgi:hypothetical protein
MALAETALAATSFASRVSRFLERVEYREAKTASEREAIHQLRFDAYLREGYVSPSFPRRLTDSLDDLPNAWTFGIYVDSALCATIRFHILTRDFRDSFAHELFPDVLDPLLDAGHVMLEPSKFAIARDEAQRHPELPYATIRLGMVGAAFFGTTENIATVRREHMAFHRRVYSFKQLCPPRDSDKFPMPVYLIGHDHRTAAPDIMARYPFNRASDAEQRALFARPYGPQPRRERAADFAVTAVASP